jgi:hypothetical protein
MFPDYVLFDGELAKRGRQKDRPRRLRDGADQTGALG